MMIGNPLQSISDAIVFSSRDWSVNERDAWVYGIVIGWGHAIAEVAEQHRWSPAEVERLQALHKRYQQLSGWKWLKDAAEDGEDGPTT